MCVWDGETILFHSNGRCIILYNCQNVFNFTAKRVCLFVGKFKKVIIQGSWDPKIECKIWQKSNYIMYG